MHNSANFDSRLNPPRVDLGQRTAARHFQLHYWEEAIMDELWRKLPDRENVKHFRELLEHVSDQSERACQTRLVVEWKQIQAGDFDSERQAG
jgi:hypothetical protein